MTDRSESTKQGLRCWFCGETAPEPEWICLHRAAGTAVKGRLCDYSVEGDARLGIDLRAVYEEARARASGIPVEGGGSDVG